MLQSLGFGFEVLLRFGSSFWSKLCSSAARRVQGRVSRTWFRAAFRITSPERLRMPERHLYHLAVVFLGSIPGYRNFGRSSRCKNSAGFHSDWGGRTGQNNLNCYLCLRSQELRFYSASEASLRVAGRGGGGFKKAHQNTLKRFPFPENSLVETSGFSETYCILLNMI